MSRPEFAAAIATEAARKTTNTVGWGLAITPVGPNQRVRLTNEDGFSEQHVLQASEGLSTDDIVTEFLSDSISAVRSARAAPPPQAQGNARGNNK